MLREVHKQMELQSLRMLLVEVVVPLQSRRNHHGSRIQLWSDTEGAQIKAKDDMTRTLTTRSGC